MARKPTRFSRTSIGYVDSARTVADVDAGDTDPIFSTSGPIAIGEDAALTLLSSTTHAIDFGNVTLQGASETTVGISDATRGDTFVVTPDSEWSGTGGSDNNLVVHAYSGDTTGEVTVVANNSGATDHNPAETIFRLTRIAWSSFL